MRVAIAAALLGLLSPGCTSTPDQAPCAFVGDPSQPPSLELLAMRDDQTVDALDDGGAVSLVTPPQGGRVVFVGVRARNLDGCSVQLTGALRDLTSRQVRVDSRTVNLTPTGDGWVASGFGGASSFSNIAACPNEWATSDLYGHVFGLEVDVEDREKRTASASITVVPECTDPDAIDECRCICAAGYQLGQTCPADGGADGAAE
jgi:hypothetical protein